MSSFLASIPRKAFAKLRKNAYRPRVVRFFRLPVFISAIHARNRRGSRSAEFTCNKRITAPARIMAILSSPATAGATESSYTFSLRHDARNELLGRVNLRGLKRRKMRKNYGRTWPRSACTTSRGIQRERINGCGGNENKGFDVASTGEKRAQLPRSIRIVSLSCERNRCAEMSAVFLSQNF